MTSDPNPKRGVLYARVTSQTKRAFAEEVARLEGPWTPSDVMRELVIAFIEKRIVLEAPDTKKESLYVPRSQD